MGTQCEKWDAMRAREGADVLPMWVADMDFESPPAVVEAITARAQRLTFGYTCSAPEDDHAYIDFWQRRHHLTVDPAWMLSSPCVVTGLKRCVLALTQPGERVIVQPPVYGPFFASVTENGRQLAENPLLVTDEGYRMDFDGLEALLRDGCRVVMICNPHNPVGRCWTRAELETLISLCARYGAKIISDEIHADFVFAPHVFTPILALPGAKEIAVALSAPSKTFNVAGLQKSTMLVPDEALRERIAHSMSAHGVVSDNIFALAAARAAYEHGDAWLDGLMDYLRTSRRMVYDFIARRLPHIHVADLQATYLMWLDCRALGLTDEALHARTVKEARIAFTDGTAFGALGSGFVRLNIGCPHAQLEDALLRMEKAFALRA